MKWFIILIVLLLAIVGISAFLFAQSDNNLNNVTNNISDNGSNINISNSNNSSNINISSNFTKNDVVFTNHKGKTDKNNVTVIANCQKTAYQGTNASIIWKIINNGNKTIENVVASDQSAHHEFGSIKPGETKVYNFTTYIPTNEDLELDFGAKDGQWPGPLWWGGFGVTYKINGEKFSTNANSMEINVKV